MNKNRNQRCIKDDSELHQWVEWVKKWQQERGITEPPYDPKRAFQIAAEVKARLNSKPAGKPSAVKTKRKAYAKKRT